MEDLDLNAAILTEKPNSVIPLDRLGPYCSRRIEDLQKMKEAFVEDNFADVQSIAHRWAGSGETYGFHTLGRLGFEIESGAKERSAKINRLMDLAEAYLKLKSESLALEN